MQIDGNDIRYPAGAGVAVRIKASIEGAGADGDNPFWRRRRSVSPFQRLAHIRGHGSGNQQHVGMARRRDEFQSEPLQIIEWVVQGVNFQFAGVARAGVDLADRQAAAENTRQRRA